MIMEKTSALTSALTFGEGLHGQKIENMRDKGKEI